jgi:HK97 family phage major capsid protein
VPYPNEHAARLKDPAQYDEFRRENNKFGDGIHAIWGIKTKPKRKAELQAIRFDAKKWTVAAAKKWLKDHGYKPIAFEPASGGKGKAMPVSTEERIQLGVMYRSAEISREAVDEEKRTVELSFSSEEPVERWFGLEILDHSPKSVRLGRLKAGGAFLVDHDTRDQVGVVEKVSIDSSARKGRAVVRFGKGARAQEIFQDVVDGIRRFTSVGYRVYKMVLEEEEKNKPRKYRVTDWEPLEISIVAVPADMTVGVGRGEGGDRNEVLIERRSEMAKEVENAVETQSAAPETRTDPLPDVSAIKDQARQEEMERVKTILAIGERFRQTELARQFVENGKSVDEFREALLERITGEDKPLRPAPDPEIGLGKKEVKEYRFLRLLNALANPTDRRAQEAAAFEFECSRAFAKQVGVEPKGVFVPADVLRQPLADPSEVAWSRFVNDLVSRLPAWRQSQRDLVVGTNTAGGYTVATELLASSFIEMLRNSAITMQLGTVLSGLTGNIAIPKQTGGATAYWVAESGAPTESQQTFGQLALSPKTVGAYTDISRKLLIQSSIDVEAFVRKDLATTVGIAIDAAAIKGGGTNEPTGILSTSGIGDVDLGTNGGPPTWAAIVELETDVASANAAVGKLAYLTNAKARGKLKTTPKVSGMPEYLWDTRSPEAPVNGYPCYVSNNVPDDLTDGTSSNLSAMIFGNWADLLFGLWAGLDVLVDPYTGGAAGTVRVRVMQSVDVGVRHAESFSAIQDMQTT